MKNLRVNRSYSFRSPEMHCGACELIVERALRTEGNVLKVKANAALSTVNVQGDFDESPEELARRFTRILEPKGYSIALATATERTRFAIREFVPAVFFSSIVIAGFVGLQRAGLVNLFNPQQMNLTASFLIGVIASLSSCMALVGGLLLSVAANSGRMNPSARHFGNVMFHAGRLVSFFVLGGLIGAIGRAFTLSLFVTVMMNATVALIMLLLGLNLLDLVPALRRLQPRAPAFVSRRLLRVERLRHGITPALLGLITFFLPCGFTQSMQLFALTTGSFLSGALTMLAFAAGTFPVLALISLASINLPASRVSGIFFKTAGLIVIAFASMNLVNALAVIGLVRPLLNI